MVDDRLILVSDLFFSDPTTPEIVSKPLAPIRDLPIGMSSPPLPPLSNSRSLFPSGFRRTPLLTNDMHVRRSQIFARAHVHTIFVTE